MKLKSEYGGFTWKILKKVATEIVVISFRPWGNVKSHRGRSVVKARALIIPYQPITVPIYPVIYPLHVENVENIRVCSTA